MSPEEVNLIASAILPQLKVSQAETFIIATVVGLLGSLAGAYAGSYVKKRGENKANREYFEELRQQLKKTTEDTESIKTVLSINGWKNQQHWIHKEKYYTEIITHLTDWQFNVSKLLDYYPTDLSVVDDEIKKSEHYQKLSRGASEACKGVEKCVGPALVFLSDHTNEILEWLMLENWLIGENTFSRHEALSEIAKHTLRARNILLQEAIRELRGTEKTELT